MNKEDQREILRRKRVLHHAEETACVIKTPNQEITIAVFLYSANLKIKSIILALTIIMIPAFSYASIIPRIIDGDTLAIGDEVYRLAGIDAPEIAQNCIRDNKKWKCGIESANKLKRITSQGVNCSQNQRDMYDRWISDCVTPDGVNVNQWMVVMGWAVAYKKFSNLYTEQENIAKLNSAGIWNSTFDRPSEFRKSVWEGYSTKAPDPNCPIKGNINSKNQKIYHTPWGSRHYSRTKINLNKGERWFCSELGAVKAGWRPPYQ